MKIKINLDKLPDCIRVIVTIIDTEETFSNRLFENSLDYPSDKRWIFIENKNNVNYIEFIACSHRQAQRWADNEIKALKNKLHI